VTGAALRWDARNEQRSFDRGQEKGGAGVGKVARDLIALFYAALPNGLPASRAAGALLKLP
jgi:hypothetical protein